MAVLTFSRVACSAAFWVVFMLAGCGSGGGGTPPSVGISSTPSSSVVPSSASSLSSLTASSVPSLAASSFVSQSSSEQAMDCGWNDTVVALDSAVASTTIEAEQFDICDTSVSDTTATQDGDASYRITSADLTADASASNGVYVSHTAASEYLEYSLAVTSAGLYSARFNARFTQGANAVIAVSVDGTAYGSAAVTSAVWADAMLAGVYLRGGSQTLRISFAQSGIELDTLTLSSQEEGNLTAADIVSRMGTGLNLGNTLDVPKGQDWGATPESEAYFTGITAAGFGHVRIPVTWDGYTAKNAPYAIEADRLQRVEQAVDWALAKGLYVIVNAHHEKWFKGAYPAETTAIPVVDMERLEAIWRQVAERLQYKPKRLLFEILNEPEGMTLQQMNTVNTRILAVMRSSNPERAVVFSGNGYTPYGSLLAAAVPNATNIIGNFHSYDPWPFAGQCARRWGSDADKTALRAIYQAVASWSAQKGVPATVNEFGAALYDFENPENICNAADRKAYLRHHVELQKEFGIAGTAWDDDGSFRIYDRKNNAWDAVLQSIIF